MPRRFTIAAAAFVGLLAPAAAAQPRDHRAADALFKEGRAAFEQGDFPRACARFEESERADPAVGTRLNLALCEDRIGKLLQARQHLAEVIAALPAGDDRLPFARQLADKLDSRIPHLTITFGPGAPADTEAHDEGDGRTIPPGVPVAMEAGDHRIVVVAPGRVATHETVTLVEGQSEKRTIAVGALPAIPVAPAPIAAPVAPPESKPVPPPPSSSAGVRRTIGIAVGGVGVVGLGLAAVTGAMLLGKKSEVDAHCPDKQCDAEGLRLKSRAEKTPLLPLNTASWILGIAGVGAGVTLILTSRGGSADPGAAVTAFALPGGGGVDLRGRF